MHSSAWAGMAALITAARNAIVNRMAAHPMRAAKYQQEVSTMADFASGLNWSDFYSGIVPDSGLRPPVASGGGVSRGVNIPNTAYPTPSQLAAMQAVPANSYQTPRAQPLNIATEPYGYSFPDTGNAGRATGAMTQQLANGVGQQKRAPLEITVNGGNPALSARAPTFQPGMLGRGSYPMNGFSPNFPVASTPQIRQAYADMVEGKPGAQKLYADLLANPASTMGQANPQPTRRQGLFDLLFGGKTGGGQGGSGLAALLSQAPAQPQAPRTLSYAQPGMTPSQSYSKTNQDAIARASAAIGGTGGSSSQSSSGGSSSNLGGVSSSGRRYDYDNNQWV